MFTKLKIVINSQKMLKNAIIKINSYLIFFMLSVFSLFILTKFIHKKIYNLI